VAVVSRSEARRTPAHARPARAELTLSAEQAARAVRQLREGDRAAAAGRAADDDRSSATTLARLQQAILERRRVWVGYVDPAGRRIERIVEPLALDGGYLSAYDQTSDTTRVFAVHRITGVSAQGAAPTG
jgi:predicted DNA-binding transcriptional regulator YafY